jgi:ABC-type phosphate transport system permease subunit
VLSESSYLTALYVYIGAALLIMLYLGWWLAHHWSAGMVALAVLLAGALLLTPAYPRDGVETFAPALVVATFQWLTEGVEGARHALRPLAFTCLVAVVLALLLRLSIFRKRAKGRAPRPAKTAASA